MKYFFSRQIIFVDQEKKLHYFTVRFRWDGVFDITDLPAFNEKKRFILVLDSEIPYRRKFQFNTKQVSRAAILAASEGGFPFEIADCYVALGAKEQDCYLFALNKAYLESLTLVSGSYNTVLVSDFDKNAIKQALTEWMAKGALYDFLGKRSFFKPTRWLLLSIGLIAGMTLIGAYWTWSLHFEKEARFKKQQMMRLSDQAQPLLIKRMAVSHMQAAIGAFYELSEMEAPLAIELLGRILEKIPEGVNIVDIKFTQQQLEIKGWGNNIQKEWVEKLDVKFKDIEINDLKDRDHFVLRIDVSG